MKLVRSGVDVSFLSENTPNKEVYTCYFLTAVITGGLFQFFYHGNAITQREKASFYTDFVGNPFNDTTLQELINSFGRISIIPESTKFVFVSSKQDLPTAIGGVITLLSEYTYYFTIAVDLTGDRLVCLDSTTILGSSSESSSITSTGLSVGVALITSIYTLPIRHITLKDVDTAIDLDGTLSTMALDWTGVNFSNIPNVGVVNNSDNFIFSKGALLNSKGLVFSGTIGTIGIDSSILVGDGAAGNIIEVDSTAIISRRFRIIYSSMVAFGSTVGINVNASATIPPVAYILDTVNFSGAGTYLSGVGSTNNKSLFNNCIGINNSAEVCQYYMNGNATTTVISATNTPVKILGTTTNSIFTQKFTHKNNRATYTGAITKIFSVNLAGSVESGNNNQIGVYIFKNSLSLDESEVYVTTNGAGKAENAFAHTLVELSTGDYLEIFIENNTGVSNILTTNLNVIIT